MRVVLTSLVMAYGAHLPTVITLDAKKLIPGQGNDPLRGPGKLFANAE